MFDGVIITLGDIRHISYLKRNLISLNTLNFKEYKYIGESGILKGSESAPVVIKGQRKSINLYVLYGAIDTNDTQNRR